MPITILRCQLEVAGALALALLAFALAPPAQAAEVPEYDTIMADAVCEAAPIGNVCRAARDAWMWSDMKCQLKGKDCTEASKWYEVFSTDFLMLMKAKRYEDD